MDLKEYLRLLHKEIIYADCAGERAYIPSLHHNRLVKLQEFVEEIVKLSAKIRPKTFENENSEKMTEVFVDSNNVSSKEFSRVFHHVESFYPELANSAKMNKNFRFLEMIEQNFSFFMEKRNKLLVEPRAEEYLTRLAPSVDILEHIFDQEEKLHIIHGDPGFGKTIHLQQLAERFVQLQRETESPVLPIYVKAKHLAKQLENHTSSIIGINKDEEDIYDVEDEKDTIWEFTTYANQKELHNVLTASMADTHFPEDRQFPKAFPSLLGRYDGQLVLFVDAFDETAENDMPHLVHFLSRMTMEENNAVVLTNRNSHSLPFGKLWSKMPGTESQNHKLTKYHIDFTPDELRYDMPEKLMAAWEIDGMVVEMRMEERYEAFHKVLTHPLFVGFFALMMKENQMMDHDLEDDDFELSIKEYTPNHVVFLNNVVDLGIKKAINDRNVKVTPERMREIYEAIAYGYFVSDGSASIIENLLRDLQIVGILEVNKTELEAIKNGVGPLYSSDGKQLQWTHKGMWEIGASRYAFQLPDLISNRVGKPELFLLSYLQQHSEHVRVDTSMHGETLKNGLSDIFQHDSNHNRFLVAAMWNAFVPEIPMFDAVYLSPASRIEVVIKKDLDERNTFFAQVVEAKLNTGDTKYISYVNFDDCKSDFMEVAHLFNLTRVSFIQAYGELRGFGAWAAEETSRYQFTAPPEILRFLSDDNKHSYVDTMARIDKRAINPIRIVSRGRENFDENAVDTTQFLFVKWHELHEQIISRFFDVLNNIGTNLQIPELEEKLEGVDYDPAVLAHAVLSDRTWFGGNNQFFRDVPLEVIKLLGF